MNPIIRLWVWWISVNIAVYVITGSLFLAFLAGIVTVWFLDRDLDRGYTL